MGEFFHHGHEYQVKISALAEGLRAVVAKSPDDRISAIVILEQIAETLRAEALSMFQEVGRSGSDGEADYGMDFYENMRVYDLLSSGWGVEFYSSGPQPDHYDERLLHSLVTIITATNLVLPGFDLNKRSLEAFAFHLDKRRQLVEQTEVFIAISQIAVISSWKKDD